MQTCHHRRLQARAMPGLFRIMHTHITRTRRNNTWSPAYHIAGKFGGNYIWRNGLQAAKDKYWRNLNLAIGNRAYKFLLRHRVSYGGSPHVVRLKYADRSRSHGRVSTRELCLRPSHIDRVPITSGSDVTG